MHRPPLLRALACAAAVAVSACADRTPTSGIVSIRPAPDLGVTRLRCTADVRSGTVDCAPAAAPGARGDLIVGGQDVYVKLRTTGVAFSAGVLSADVSVQNLLAQPMGTTDGVAASPNGVRVFFASGPVATVGTGPVTVQNPDGTAVFTASEQPFFQYDGILGAGATSAARTWKFAVDPGVTTFGFTLYVSAPMPREDGWVTLVDPTSSMAPGESIDLDAWIMTSGGTLVQGAVPPITWTTSDPAVATVAPGGHVTAVGLGTVTITATVTGTTRSGYTRLTVAALDTTAPSVTGLTVAPGTVNAGDSVAVSVTATDAGGGVASFQVTVRGASGPAATCFAVAPTFAPGERTLTCKALLPPGAADGAWTITALRVVDPRGNTRTLDAASLASAGLPSGFTVSSASPDATAPTLTGLTITPGTVPAGDSVAFTASASDAGTGIARFSVVLSSPSGTTAALSCSTLAPATGTANAGTFTCKIGIPPGSRPGTWTVVQLRLFDVTGNVTFLRTSQLAAAGAPTTFTVTDPTPDVTAPTLRSVTLSPDPVARSDSLTITVGVADAGTGVARVIAVLQPPTFIDQYVTCDSSTLATGTAAFGTFQCKVAIPANAEAGTWRLIEVDILDVTRNRRSMVFGDLQALGYPTTLVVAP